METHVAGPQRGNRRGSVASYQTIPIDTALATTDFVTATAKKLLTINATTARPVYLQLEAVIQTASNAAGTNTLSVGQTGAGYTDMLSAVDLKGAANVAYPASNAIIKRILTAKTDIYAIVTCAAFGAAGKAFVNLKLIELNVVKVRAATS